MTLVFQAETKDLIEPLKELPCREWLHIKRQSKYLVGFLLPFTNILLSGDEQGEISGAVIADGERFKVGRHTAVMQCETPVEYGTVVVFYSSSNQSSGKLWARPLIEFLDGRFDPVVQTNGK